MTSFTRKNKAIPAVSLIFAMIMLVLAGCAGGSAGYLKHNRDLIADYRDKKLPENLNYYYTGRALLPYAVIGIDPAYTFKGKTWFKIESRDALYSKIENLSNLEPYHDMVYGKDILGPGDKPIGVWFSYYNTTGVVVDEAGKVVEVFNPYRPNSESGFRGGY